MFAWSSFGICQGIYSLIDAALDALAVFILGGASIGEAILALFSGGATAVPAVATAIVAAIEGLSSAWGYMMTAVYIIVGLSAALGAATTDVTWVAIPEG